MSVIGLTGPHAIGKTTAARRWALRYPTLTAVLADNQLEIAADSSIRVRAWQGTQTEKARLVSLKRVSGITVIESARTTAINYFLPGEPVIFVVCDWEVMDRHMRDRCREKGKTFREDYWHPRRIEAECKARYINYARKHLRPDQYRVFTVNDQARDWPAVDEYFGELYRKLHNRIVRERRSPCPAS